MTITKTTPSEPTGTKPTKFDWKDWERFVKHYPIHPRNEKGDVLCLGCNATLWTYGIIKRWDGEGPGWIKIECNCTHERCIGT